MKKWERQAWDRVYILLLHKYCGLKHRVVATYAGTMLFVVLPCVTKRVEFRLGEGGKSGKRGGEGIENNREVKRPMQ